MDPRDNSRREPSTLVAELLDAAARVPRDGDAEQVREALVVRHALQPFSPAAFGAAHGEAGEIEPRRFSYDARWRAASEETAGVAGRAGVRAAHAVVAGVGFRTRRARRSIACVAR